MNPILQKIVATKRQEIEALAQVNFPERNAPYFSLKQALKKPNHLTILAECKKGSPSAGILRPDYNALSIANEYFKAGAAAISVLTDKDYFHGDLQDLIQISSVIPLPILRKDFIIDELQIKESWSAGASAILLIARILDSKRLAELKSFATKLGLEILIETHTKQEVELALDLGFDIIGINTRDLDTFAILPDLIESLSSLIPKDKVCVGESGILGNADFSRFQGKVDALLVGTYFMKSMNIPDAFRALVSQRG